MLMSRRRVNDRLIFKLIKSRSKPIEKKEKEKKKKYKYKYK